MAFFRPATGPTVIAGRLMIGGALLGMLSLPLHATPNVPHRAPGRAQPATAGQPQTAVPAAHPVVSAAEVPECLAVTRSSSATYVIENKSCPEQSVLTAIELADEGALARCFTKKIRTQISLASAGAVPLINYQCIEGTPGCSVEVLRHMFPECHAG